MGAAAMELQAARTILIPHKGHNVQHQHGQHQKHKEQHGLHHQRMGYSNGGTQSGAGAGAGGGAWLPTAGAPQRRVLFRPALSDSNKSQFERYSGSGNLPRPLNASGGESSGGSASASRPMAGTSSSAADLAGPSAASPLPSSHPSLNWALASRIGAGLSNLGNTCFLNSVLQCLTYTPPLAGYLDSWQHKPPCRAAGFCAMCALQEHVRQALSSSGGVVSPSNLVKNLRCISKSFRMWRQEDAHEYMRYLIEALHNSCLPPGAKANTIAAQEKSLIHKIFGGRLRSQVKCTVCSTCSNTYDPLLDLSLEIVRADSLTKALNRFTAVEALEGDNKYHCSHCRKKVRALKQFTIDKSPNILTIQFKRFSGTGSSGGKIDKKIEFGRTLDMKPYISNPQDSDAKYTLYAVLVHAGWSTHSGHYYCFVRTAGDMWHSLDDSRVKQVSERTVLDQKAYILFYLRDSVSRLSSAAEQHLRNPQPALKKLLSDGAGETADEMDSSADDLDVNDHQESKVGSACGSHMYSNGLAQDTSDRGVTAASSIDCPPVRPAGNSQGSRRSEEAYSTSGANTMSANNLTSANDPVVEANGKAAGVTVSVSIPNPMVNAVGAERYSPVIMMDKVSSVLENVKGEATVVGSEHCAPSAEAPLSALLNISTVSTAEGSKLEDGEINCSTSGGDDDDDDDDVDWEEYHKQSSSVPHSYMRLLYFMPHTRRYFMARSLPIHRDRIRKRVASRKGQGDLEDGHGEVVSNGGSTCRKGARRRFSAIESSGPGKKQKVVDCQEDLSSGDGGDASAPKRMLCNGHSKGRNLEADALKVGKPNGLLNGSGSEHVSVLRERLQSDGTCQAGDWPSIPKDVAWTKNGGKNGSAGHIEEGCAILHGAMKQSNGTVNCQGSEGDILENGSRTGNAHKDTSIKSPIPLLKNSSYLHSNGLYGFEVPRWGEMEADANGSVEDVDTLLCTHKTALPKRDPWDEEYDRGKVKKVRNGITKDKQSVVEVAGVANPFQVISSAKQRRQAGVRGHIDERRG